MGITRANSARVLAALQKTLSALEETVVSPAEEQNIKGLKHLILLAISELLEAEAIPIK